MLLRVISLESLPLVNLFFSKIKSPFLTVQYPLTVWQSRSVRVWRRHLSNQTPWLLDHCRSGSSSIGIVLSRFFARIVQIIVVATVAAKPMTLKMISFAESECFSSDASANVLINIPLRRMKKRCLILLLGSRSDHKLSIIYKRSYNKLIKGPCNM